VPSPLCFQKCFPSSCPNKIQKRLFFQLQNILHTGRLASRRLVSSRFIWRGLARDVTAWAKTCLHCQQSKTHCHTNTRPLYFPVPQQRFSHLHIDLVGLLQFNNNCNYIFMITDRTSKWMEAIPLSATAAADCACAFVFHWITHFVVHAMITSVRGRNSLQHCGLRYARCLTSRIARPQLTTMRQMVRSKDCTATSRTPHLVQAATWAKEILCVLLGLRLQPREDSGISHT
jgi:hypothetical protein